MSQRRSGTCVGCGADLVRGAAWCGACGARVEAAPVEELDTEPSAVELDDDAPHARGGRYLTVVLVVGLVAALVAAGALREPPAEIVLGHAGNATGVTSTGLPPADLRLAWSRPRPDEGWWHEVGTVVADGGLVRLGDLVVDVATGELVRLAEQNYSGDGPLVLGMHGSDVVVVDQLRGTIEARTPMPEVSFDGPLWPSASTDETIFLGGDNGAALIATDGTLLAEYPGWHEGWNGSGLADPAAVALWSEMDMHSGGTSGDLALFSLRDGEVLLTRVDSSHDDLHVHVVGDRAVLAAPTWPAHDEPPMPAWFVELVDATTGEVLTEVELQTHGPPRIVGRTGDGGTLLALEYENSVQVWEAPAAAGDLVQRTSVGRSNWGSGDGNVGTLTNTASLTGEGTIVELVTTEQVRARALDGGVLWSADVEPTDGLRVDGGVVALIPPESNAPPGHDTPPAVVQLLDVADGRHLTSVPLQPRLGSLQWGPRPGAVVNGAVGIGHMTGWSATSAMEVVNARWYELLIGDNVPVQDVFQPWLADGTRMTGELWLAGLVQDDEGRLVPHLGGTQTGDDLRLLQDGELTTHDLPVADAVRRSEGWVQPIGANTTHLAVWHEEWDMQADTSLSATHIAERVGGGVVTLPDVMGLLLTDDVFIGREQHPRDWSRDMPLVGHDPATGTRLWTGPVLENRARQVVHDHELLLVGDAYRWTAVNTRDGSVAWRYESPVELFPTVVLGPNQALFATTTGQLIALDRRSGGERWRRDMGAPVTSLSGAGEGALVATLDEELLVLDSDGRTVQRRGLDGVALRAVALGDTVVLQYADRIVGLRPDGPGFTAEDEVDLP